jgi:hypothetical protein
MMKAQPFPGDFSELEWAGAVCAGTV